MTEQGGKTHGHNVSQRSRPGGPQAKRCITGGKTGQCSEFLWTRCFKWLYIIVLLHTVAYLVVNLHLFAMSFCG